ncbi:MAG: serine hydrolase [Gammaproteobacteria bacterium]|nr:serine hydrolase [Gammaproteobacteria bacterium]
MRLLKSVCRWLAFALLALVLAGFLPAWLGAYGTLARRYADTFTTNPLDPAYSWYDSLELVPGGGGPPLAQADPATSPFGPGVLEGAATYAAVHASDSLIVLYRGELAFERYWNGKGPDSPLGTHSLAKTLTAILIGHALADGLIGSIDDPVFFHLAEWDDETHRPITIRHLLNMASGLEESYEFWPWSERVERAMGTDIEAANLRVPVAGPPGVSFRHINPPPQLLAMVIERATGRRYAEYLSEKFWQPIGARDAQLYVDHPGGTAHADCCMWTTIMDWARVGEALRSRGLWQGRRVIPAGWPEQMVLASPAYMNYGMMLWLGNVHEPLRRYDPGQSGFENRHSEPFAEGVFYLDGLGKQRVWVVPGRELVIVRTGRDHPDWDEARIPNLLIRGMQVPPLF